MYFLTELTQEALACKSKPLHCLTIMTKKDLINIHLTESAMDLVEMFGRDEMKMLLQNHGDDNHFIIHILNTKEVLWSPYE